jgi:hypothetical protein
MHFTRFISLASRFTSVTAFFYLLERNMGARVLLAFFFQMALDMLLWGEGKFIQTRFRIAEISPH